MSPKTEKTITAGAHAFHRAVYDAAKKLFGPLIFRRYNLTCAQEQPPQPYILLANHTTPLDPVLVALAFPQTYFALPEKYKGTPKRWLVRRLFSPIVRTASGAHILDAVAAGYNVCVFPENTPTLDGETGEIPQQIADIVKRSGATLVAYRLEGGFLTKPVWSRQLRRGRMRGYLAHVYSPKELGGMKTADLAAQIRSDLWVDAFQINEDCQQSYCGKNRAEGLETVLHRCPLCGGTDTLRARGDRLSCTACGLDVVWNDFGRFEAADGGTAPFATVRDWHRWQKEQERQTMKKSE